MISDSQHSTEKPADVRNLTDRPCIADAARLHSRVPDECVLSTHPNVQVRGQIVRSWPRAVRPLWSACKAKAAIAIGRPSDRCRPIPAIARRRPERRYWSAATVERCRGSAIRSHRSISTSGAFEQLQEPIVPREGNEPLPREPLRDGNILRPDLQQRRPGRPRSRHRDLALGSLQAHLLRSRLAESAATNGAECEKLPLRRNAPEIEAQNKFLRRMISSVIDVLAYSPYQQLRIEIVGTDQPLRPHWSPHWAIISIIGRNASSCGRQSVAL